MIEAGIITAIGIIWLLCRFNLKRIAGHAAFWDISITGLLVFVFLGTYAGMVTGMLAGVIVSLFLTIIRKFAGYEKLQVVRLPNERIGQARWVSYPPNNKKPHKKNKRRKSEFE